MVEEWARVVKTEAAGQSIWFPGCFEKPTILTLFDNDRCNGLRVLGFWVHVSWFYSGSWVNSGLRPVFPALTFSKLVTY